MIPLDSVPAEPLVDATKARRTVRYVHLNPCRAHLAVDPLAWPFSTHRDRLGCAARPVLPQARDPEAFHRYVSSDPSVDPTGTPLPARALATRDLDRLAEAVSSAARTPGAAWRRFELRARRVVVVEALLRCRATADALPLAAK